MFRKRGSERGLRWAVAAIFLLALGASWWKWHQATALRPQVLIPSVEIWHHNCHHSLYWQSRLHLEQCWGEWGPGPSLWVESRTSSFWVEQFPFAPQWQHPDTYWDPREEGP